MDHLAVEIGAKSGPLLRPNRSLDRWGKIIGTKSEFQQKKWAISDL